MPLPGAGRGRGSGGGTAAVLGGGGGCNVTHFWGQVRVFQAGPVTCPLLLGPTQSVKAEGRELQSSPQSGTRTGRVGRR